MSNFKRCRGPVRRWDRCSTLSSFTLVEVVFAIAIFAFALVSILGLMAYTSQLVQQTDMYARLSNVSSQVLGRLQSQSYAVTSTNITANGAYYFTADGLPTNSAGAYFQCNLSNVTPLGSSLNNFMQVQVSIRWPKPQFSNTNIIVTSILNYD
jgi:type II secretory pathway pseudopilin PulG